MDNERLRILLLGNGGREHALAWKLSLSPRLEELYVVPGNGGMGQISKVQLIPSLTPDNLPDLLGFAREARIDLVVVGPEVPLCAGIEGHFRSAGIRFFGPTSKALFGPILPLVPLHLKSLRTFITDQLKHESILDK